jgi:CRP-like cAMP-binding protein
VPGPGSLLTGNLLLAALPRADRRRLCGHDEPVELALAHTLTEPGERIGHVFFPIDSFISLVTPIDGRASLEVGLVGHEGMLGVTLMLGVDASPLRGLVQGAGLAWRFEARTFVQALERSAAMRRVLNRYLYVTLAQLAQTAACTRFHVIEARLARWLLMTRDRARSDSFHVTHEFLAYMLGVRRVGITRAACALQSRKLIRYSRGSVEVLDGRGLEAASCSCYAADRETYRRAMA